MKLGRKFALGFVAVAVAATLMFVAGNVIAPSTRQGMRDHAEEALRYCRQNGLRTDYCIFVDFSVHSGKSRFFVWDFNRGEVVYSTICEHGHGGGSTCSKADFSNVSGTNCSSLGRYLVLNRRNMYSYKNVPCYELKGVDLTNSNAHARGILIHPGVSQFQTFPFPLPFMTEGCFGISLRGFDKVCYYKDMSSKPMLLWAY